MNRMTYLSIVYLDDQPSAFDPHYAVAEVESFTDYTDRRVLHIFKVCKSNQGARAAINALRPKLAKLDAQAARPQVSAYQAELDSQVFVEGRTYGDQ